jgi:hypothetical protein
MVQLRFGKWPSMKAKVSTLIALMLVTSASSSPAAENLSSLATPIAEIPQMMLED